MTKLSWLLALFALAVGIALAARFNEGYLLRVLLPYRAEVSLNLAIFLVVSIFVVVYGLLRAIGLALALPNRVQAFRERRRRVKAAIAFDDAVRLLFEGRFGRALKKAGEAHAAAHSPGLAALLAARAAPLLREPDTEKAWLERVRRDDPRLESAQWMLEAEMFLDTGDFEAALITLQGLQRLTGRHIAALRLELRAQEGCANWPLAGIRSWCSFVVRWGAMIRPLLTHGPRNGCPSILGTHNCCWHRAVSVGRSGCGERPRTILRPPSRWPISTRFGSNWRVFSSRPTARMKPFGTTGPRLNSSPEPPVVAVLSRRAHAQSRGGSSS